MGKIISRARSKVIYKRYPGLIIIIWAGLSWSGAASSAGLYITEWGNPSQGTSDAGAGVLAEDASTAFTNPAGILLLEESQSMVTAVYIAGKAEFDSECPDTDPTCVRGDNGGDAFQNAVAGSVYYANPFAEKFGWGVSFNSISAAGLDYGNNFVGRYWAEEITLLTVTLNPSIAYRPSDDWTIALSLPVMYGQLDLDVAVPGPLAVVQDGEASISNGDDISVGLGVSTLWEVSERTRLGLVYWPKHDLDFDSDLTITLPAGGLPQGAVQSDVSLTFPQSIRGSASQRIGDKLTVLGLIAWEDWSKLDDVLISTAAGTGVLERGWRDAWRFAVGMRWETGAHWKYYSGIAYDTDVTTDGRRTADMPVDRQIRLSAGASYKYSEKVTIGGVLTYVDLGDADINNSENRPVSGIPWRVEGDYDQDMWAFALNINWK
jgi:long-chain fatty acid transport protein